MLYATERPVAPWRKLILIGLGLAGLLGLVGLSGLSTATPGAGVAAAPLTPFPTATCPPEGWSYVAPYPFPVDDPAAATLGNRLYVFGGRNWDAPSLEPIRDAYRYNVGTNTWTAITALPAKRSGHVAASDGTRIFIYGGSDYTEYKATLWSWNPNLGYYQTLADAPIATWQPTLVYLDGFLYRMGGITNNGGYTTQVHRYNIATNTWTTAAPYPAAAVGMVAIGYNGYLYVGGGQNDINISKTYRYNPATNTWSDTAVRDFPSAHVSSVTGIVNGYWVVAGGGGNGSTIALDMSNPTGTWQNRAAVPNNPSDWAGSVLGRHIYAVGDHVSSTWRYSDGCP